MLSPKPSTLANIFDIGRKLDIGVGNKQLDQKEIESNFNFDVGKVNE